jgi:pyruvate/2-oxoacid:ferredoxin oxidoreductase alpha subunit/Pyruvate/2-oxoacid:ferredoxin oxidoreductase gamma subunit
MPDPESISIAFVGSGGAGALTAGNLLLEAACDAGWQGLLTRSVGPQIRGGEAAALLRLAIRPVECMAERLDLLIGIDWLNAQRFGAEIEVGPDSVVVGDPRGGELPPGVAGAGAHIISLPMKDMAKAIPEGRANMIALGLAGHLIGMSEDVWWALLIKRLGDRGQAAIEGSRASLKAGYDVGRNIDVRLPSASSFKEADRRNLSGVLAAASPPPLWGRDRVGGIPERQAPGLPPPLTPAHKGEGNPVATVAGESLHPHRGVEAVADSPGTGKRWLISGNEAAALGAIRGGIRFAAAYPITPATEILEWLAPNLAQVGGVLLQAEDELAAVNMIIGASYGGTPSLTATSGPGLSLMIEALGLATAAEVPIVVVDVMRGGPSTGIPTKSEQSDLNIAIYGCHGDAPHLVLAPQSIGDCLFTTQWATYLAEALQVPAIVLSDQFMGQARAAIERPADVAFIGRRAHARARAVAADGAAGGYKRYAIGAGGVSAMALPGTAGCQYTADGLTHTERGTPTSGAADHQAQLDKRRDKLEGFNYGDHWATIEGAGDVAVVTWGSLTGAAREGIARARADGVEASLLAPRLLSPPLPGRLAAALAGKKRVLVVEQTHGAQLHRYLRAHYDLPGEVRVLNRPGPRPINAGEIHRAILQWRAECRA